MVLLMCQMIFPSIFSQFSRKMHEFILFLSLFFPLPRASVNLSYMRLIHFSAKPPTAEENKAGAIAGGVFGMLNNQFHPNTFDTSAR